VAARAPLLDALIRPRTPGVPDKWDAGFVSFLKELDDLGYDELVMRFDGPPLDDLAESSPHVFYEEVAMLLRDRDPQAGAAFLRGRAGSDQRPARLAGALFGLSWHGAADVEHRPLLLGQLGHPDELVVQEAIDGLASLGSSQDLDVVASHATHRSPYVRGAVLRYRQRVFDAAARPWLLAGLSDPDPVVRFWALDALDDLGQEGDDQLIGQMTQDKDPDIAAHAQVIVDLRAEY